MGKVTLQLLSTTRKWFGNDNPPFFCASKLISSKWQLFVVLHGREEARSFSENNPHCIQCILILAMAIERYIVICLPTRSKSILSRPRRLCFYVIITLTLVLLGAIFAAAYRNGFYSIEGKGVYAQNKLHTQLTVDSHVYLFISYKSVARLTRALFSRQDHKRTVVESRSPGSAGRGSAGRRINELC